MAVGCYDLSLGDTIGCGTPAKADALVSEVGSAIPMDKVAVHNHDIYGQALAYIHTVLQQGVAVIDNSIAGLGGCPHAKRKLLVWRQKTCFICKRIRDKEG
jgi:hydroxymethylglutaryl-CoA lyase